MLAQWSSHWLYSLAKGWGYGPRSEIDSFDSTRFESGCSPERQKTAAATMM